MEQNENSLVPEAATDEPASPRNHSQGAEPDEFAFAGEAEEAAYWAGVADGMRNVGGAPPPRLSARARDAYPELVASAEQLGGRAHPSLLDFDPVSTRHRIDGIGPDKQREYVEALADSGVARYAAARIGVSEQAINRLRRRADARSFDLACEAARRFGARHLHSIAYERAIEGTIRRHYYHGELKGEERVYDNRLLVYLLGKTEHLVEPPPESEAVAGNWQPFVEAMEQGLPPPDLSPPPEPDEGFDDEAVGADVCEEVWQNGDGTWWTSWARPAGFDGHEEGTAGRYGYRRHLSEAEEAVVGAMEKDEAREAEAIAERDAFFGFEGGLREDEDIFSSMEAELYETSERGGDDAPSGTGGNRSGENQ